MTAPATEASPAATTNLMRRALAALAIVVVALLALAGPAAAHASSTRPTRRAARSLTQPPTQISLRFDEPVEIALGAIRLYDGAGHELDVGAAHHPNGDDTQVAVSASGLADGVVHRVVARGVGRLPSGQRRLHLPGGTGTAASRAGPRRAPPVRGRWQPRRRRRARRHPLRVLRRPRRARRRAACSWSPLAGGPPPAPGPRCCCGSCWGPGVVAGAWPPSPCRLRTPSGRALSDASEAERVVRGAADPVGPGVGAAGGAPRRRRSRAAGHPVSLAGRLVAARRLLLRRSPCSPSWPAAGHGTTGRWPVLGVVATVVHLGGMSVWLGRAGRAPRRRAARAGPGRRARPGRGGSRRSPSARWP